MIFLDSKSLQEYCRRLLLAGFWLVITVSVTSCQVRPLYNASDSRIFLSDIYVQPPSNSDDRFFYRAFKAGQGKVSQTAHYRLEWKLRYTRASSPVLLFDTAGSEWIDVTGQFTLYDQTGKSVLSFSKGARAVSPHSHNPYASARAYQQSIALLGNNLAFTVEQHLVSHFSKPPQNTAPPKPARLESPLLDQP